MECEVVAELRVRPPLPPPDFFVLFKGVYANAKSLTQLSRIHFTSTGPTGAQLNNIKIIFRRQTSGSKGIQREQANGLKM